MIIGLLARGWLETRALGLRRIVASAPPELIELYRTLGVRLTELGPPRRHWGAERVPVELAGVEDRPAFAGGPSRSVTRRSLLVSGAAAAGGALVVGVPGLAGQGPAGEDRRRAGDRPAHDRPAGAGGPGGPRAHGRRAAHAPPGRSARGAHHRPARRQLERSGGGRPVARALHRGRAVHDGRPVGAGLVDHLGLLRAPRDPLPAPGRRAPRRPRVVRPGRPVATFEGTFQNDLALDSPDNASTSLLADLSQRSARAFVLSGRRHRLGRAGLAWTLRASGRGRRLEPTTPRSQLFLSGDMTLGDAAAISPP